MLLLRVEKEKIKEFKKKALTKQFHYGINKVQFDETERKAGWTWGQYPTPPP